MSGLPFKWTGEVMLPLPNFRKMADRSFVIGQTYRLEEVQERSKRSHDHYFACIEEAWSNLPEPMLEQFPNSTILRKFALIRTGFCTMSQEVCQTHAEAQRAAGMIRRHADDYLLITVDRNVVTVHRAESQSLHAMGSKRRFQESKDKTLTYIASLLGVTREELAKAEAA